MLILGMVVAVGTDEGLRVEDFRIRGNSLESFSAVWCRAENDGALGWGVRRANGGWLVQCKV